MRLTVEDAGTGVPDDALPRAVRQVLPRARARAAGGEGGSGVGLAVVRGFADAMGGRVSARRSDSAAWPSTSTSRSPRAGRRDEAAP